MGLDHEALMRQAMTEAELARGSTGDNPWVGCVIVDASGRVLGRGHTQGPGEDHAEIGALREADARGEDVRGATMYSTLEPCSFHGRTAACSRVIVERGLGCVVLGMRDPHPRVDGAGIRTLREGGVEIVESVCEPDVRRQLGVWVVAYHRREPRARARMLAVTRVGTWSDEEIARSLAETYAIDPVLAAEIVRESRE